MKFTGTLRWPIVLISLLFSINIFSAELFSNTLLVLDPLFTHHIFIAEKSTHELHLYQNDNGVAKFVKTYQMATGKMSGDKSFQGDHRTPEGFYFLGDFIPKSELLKRYGKEGEIYGAGAFVMDYPNPIDRLLGKSGGGIWIHSTNDETRIDKGLDSRGCIVTANKDLIELSQYIELGKSMLIVVHEHQFLSKTAFEANKNTLEKLVYDWANAWQTEDIEKYLSFYDQKDFLDPVRGKYNSFKAYKTALFKNPGSPKISVKNLSLIKNGKYAIATFKQVYQSSTINDQGRKSLYLRQDEYYNWKIIYESFGNLPEKDKESDQFAFQPSMRFFPERESKSN